MTAGSRRWGAARLLLTVAIATLTIGLAAVTLSACSPAGGSVTVQVSQWASQTGISGLDSTVAGDVHDIEGARRADKPLTVRTLCGVLEEDVGQAYDQLPSPDGAITTDLDSAYLALGQGANECYSAAADGDTKALGSAYAEIESGSRHLSAGTARLAALGVR